MIEKILKFFNIKPDENQKWLLLSMLLSGFLITFISPTVVKVLYTELPTQYIAFQNLFSSIAGLIIGMLWKGKIRQTATKYFLWLTIAESIAGFILGMYLCFFSFNIWVYAICSLLYSTLITTFVGKCTMVFKTKLWTDEKREIYDNNVSIVSGIVCIIGFASAMIIPPSLKLSMFLYGLCCIIDDIGWIYVYTKNYNNLHSITDFEE